MQKPFADARLAARRSARHQADAFLWNWLGEQMIDRARTINRTFGNAAVIAPTPAFADALRAARPDWTITTASEIPEPGSSDAIIVLGTPAITNDVPAMLDAARAALIDGGLFLAGFYGGSSFAELRTALLQAEATVTNGAAARIAPMIDPGTAASLMQRSGFALPVIDHASVTATYPDLRALVDDLRQANATAVLQNVRPMPRAVWPAAEAAYAAQFSDARGRRLATLQGVFLSGWKS